MALLLVAAWALLPSLLFAQTATVERNVNLRRDPSSDHTSIRTLYPPDELDLLEPGKTNDYYHVRTDDEEEGWVWSRNLRVSSDSSGAVPADDLSGAPAALPNTISPTWSKPTPNNTSFTSTGRSSPCEATGDGGDADTNRRKNRTDVPASYHPVSFDAIANLAYPVAPKSRENWSASQLGEIEPFEGVALTVTGYLVALKPQTGGSGESTNCHWTHAAEADWHMALTKLPGQGEEDAIVVETTPRVRRTHPSWTTTALKPWIDSSNPIRVSGWLMLDPEHRNHLGRYRSTLWEVHPITKIEVFRNGEWTSLDVLP